MSQVQTEETPPPEGNGMTESQKAFQAQTDMLAHHMIGLCIATGVPPVMACLAASQIIRAVLLDLSKNNRPVAKHLLEELAASLVEFCNELGEGPTKQ